MRLGSYHQSPGIFYTIAWYVEEVQFVLINLINLLDSHWAVRWAKPYAEDARDYLAEVIANLWKADTWASGIADDVSEAIAGGDLDGLIESYAPGVWSFFQDPKGKVKGYLKDLWPAGYDLLSDPRGELNDWLEDNYPELWAFKNNPREYVLDRLQEQHQELYNFALDPLGWVTTNIGDVIDEVRWFMRDPYHFVHWYLLKLDSPLAPFWADPGEWVIDHILDWAVEAILRDWKA